MLGISRWTEAGGSYRTIQRFFATSVAWAELLVTFVQSHLFDADREYLLAGDATTVTKAGWRTHGIDRMFSGLLGKVVKGLEFFVFSMVDVRERKSYPVWVGQTVRSQAEREAARHCRRKAAKRLSKSGKKSRGRKPGSRNRDKNRLELSSELSRLNEMLKRLRELIGGFVKIKYLALDGHFGHNQAMLMVRANGLELISKLRRDARLFESYEGEQGGRGARKKYGARLR